MLLKYLGIGLISLTFWAMTMGVLHAQTVVPATGGSNISADNFATGTWTTLTGPEVHETAPGQFQPGQIRFQAPSGFVWDTGGTAPSVVVTQPKGNRITVTFSSRTSSEIIFDLSGSSSGSPPNNTHSLVFSNFRIRPAAGSPLSSGQIRNAGSSAPGGTRNYGSISMIAGADSNIRVETAPNSSGSVVSAQNIEAGSSITVYSNVRDQFNNFKRNEAATWELQNITGNVAPENLSASAASAVFTGSLVGTATINATSASLNPTSSGTLSVIHSDPATIVLVTEPSSSATAGELFSTQPVIEIHDDYSNIISSDDFTQITANRNNGDGTLQGTTSIPVTDGIGTFTDLHHTLATAIDLIFSAPGFAPVISNSITVSPAAADSLIFAVQPSNANRNIALTPPVEVQIVDEYENYVPQSGTQITLNINSGTGNISGNTALTDANGRAVFNSVSFNQVGSKNLIASGSSLDSSSVSNNFTVANAGSLAGFKIEIFGGGNIPTQTAGTAFNIQITAVDGAGDVLDGTQGRDNFGGSVNLTSNSDFSLATDVSGIGPFVNGVYESHEVELTLSGESTSITATNSAGSEAGSSNLFAVNPAAASPDSSLIIVDNNTLIADGASIADISILLRDQFGNDLIAGGDEVLISKTGAGTLSSITDNSDGTYSATLTAPNAVGSAVLTGTINSENITSSNPEVIFTFDELFTFLVEDVGGGSIGTQTAGTPFNIRITAQDEFGNTVTSFDGSGSTVQLTSNGVISSGGGTTPVFVNGVLNSHSVTLTSTGSLSFTARKTASAETGISNTFTVVPGTASAMTSTISSSESFLQNNGTDFATITVQLKDEFGNNLISGGDIVALSTTAGSLSSVSDNGDGTYTSTLTSGLSTATATITGTINAISITDNAQIFITQFNEWIGEGGGNPSGRTDWGNTSNWSLGSLPTTSQVVFIGGGQTYYPVIDGEDPIIDFLNIESGANVTLFTREITINNELSGLGSFLGNSGIINLGGHSRIANFISGSSTVNLNGSSLQELEGDFTANILNIQNDVLSSDYLEAFTDINIVSGNTLSMSSGSELVALGNINISGELIGNGSIFRFRGDINGTNISTTNTTIHLNGDELQEINGIANIKNFILDNPIGATVNNDLTVTDTLFLTNGILTMAPGFSLVSNTKEGNTENIRSRHEIAGSAGWRTLASPLISSYEDFLDGTVTQGFAGAFYDISSSPGDTLLPNVLYYDETYPGTDNQRWRAPANAANTVTAGRGYFVHFFGDIPADSRYNEPLPDTLEIQGEEHDGNGTEFTFPITYTASADTGWNFIGNPFAATIDWDDGNWIKTNMDNVIYVWDSATNDFLSWNGTAGSLGDGKISPFQAFWVKANGNGPPVLKVNKSSKTTGGIYKKSRNEFPVIGLEIASSDLKKAAHFTFSMEGKTEKDEWDAYRLLPFDTDTYLEFYSTLSNGTQLSINNLPRKFGTNIKIPIHVGGFKDGVPLDDPYIISWPTLQNVPSEWTIELEDLKNGHKLNMREVEGYEFQHRDHSAKAVSNTVSSFRLIEQSNDSRNKAKKEARFLLHISPGADADDLPDKFSLSNNYPNPFNNSTTFKIAVPIEGPLKLVIYDILGRKVTDLVNGSLTAGYHEVRWNAQTAASGIYFARLQSQEAVSIKKITLIK